MAGAELSPNFDPWKQPITLYLRDGTTITTSVEDVDYFRLFGTRSAINYGTQIGASLMLLLVLLLLTKAAKRKSFIFIVNGLCLFANLIRCILLSCFFTGTLWNPYTQLSGDWSRVASSDVATVVASNVFTLLVAALVMLSLSLQVRVVCITTRPLERYIIMTITSIMACINLGYKTAVIVYNIKQNLVFQDMGPYQTLLSTSYVIQAVTIWVFSCVFTYKLGYAIIQRRRLKMPQFGPMQIVFIMGCQTMLVPGMFHVLLGLLEPR